jgi:hypothetical protein
MLSNFFVKAVPLGFGIAIALATAILELAAPGLAEDQMVFGPRQFQFDKTGAGAVLCAWSIYLSFQAETAACGLPRKPVDDAIEQAIAEIDEFILANSSLRPTRAMLEDFKRRARESHLNALRRQGGPQNSCERFDLQHFRSLNPDQIRTSIKALLSVPREPVMNPCL